MGDEDWTGEEKDRIRTMLGLLHMLPARMHVVAVTDAACYLNLKGFSTVNKQIGRDRATAVENRLFGDKR